MDELLTSEEINDFKSRFIEYDVDDCWPWHNSLNKKGFGRFPLRGRERYAHRVSYYIANGSLPDNIRVYHKCDNRCCVNPSHLGTDDKESYLQGEKHGRAKLTEKDVVTIRHLNKQGKTNTEISKIYGVHNTTIERILRKTLWRHVK